MSFLASLGLGFIIILYIYASYILSAHSVPAVLTYMLFYDFMVVFVCELIYSDGCVEVPVPVYVHRITRDVYRIVRTTLYYFGYMVVEFTI